MFWILWFIGFFGTTTWFGARKQSIAEGVWEEEKGAAYVWLTIWIGFLCAALYVA
tara:strand:- start:2806 stop:2970 length:165 start_codon:yes stop_codon:yes gene_type:complete